jgi:hypothetical protein
MILQVREVIFSEAQDILGVKKVSVPSKNPPKCSIMWFAQKKVASHTLSIRGRLVFLCPYN